MFISHVIDFKKNTRYQPSGKVFLSLLAIHPYWVIKKTIFLKCVAEYLGMPEKIKSWKHFTAYVANNPDYIDSVIAKGIECANAKGTYIIITFKLE